MTAGVVDLILGEFSVVVVVVMIVVVVVVMIVVMIVVVVVVMIVVVVVVMIVVVVIVAAHPFDEQCHTRGNRFVCVVRSSGLTFGIRLLLVGATGESHTAECGGSGEDAATRCNELRIFFHTR